jgi:hypothetical protein
VYNPQARVYEKKAKPKGDPRILGHLVFSRSHEDEKGAERNPKDRPETNTGEENEENPERDPES